MKFMSLTSLCQVKFIVKLGKYENPLELELKMNFN